MRRLALASLLFTLPLLPLRAQQDPAEAAKPAPRGERELDLKALGARPLPTPFEQLLGTELHEPAGRPASQRDFSAGPPMGVRSADRLHWDSDAAGDLWVRGADYKARVHAGGLEFVPFLGSSAARSWPLGLSLVGASLEGEALALGAAVPLRRGETEVVLARDSLREVYRFTTGSVEQLFEFDALPRRGALQLELAFSGELAGTDDALGLRFDGPEGGVRYGDMTVIDADGRRLEVASRLQQGRILLEVPAAFVADARLPLVIDPLITTLSVATGPVDCGYPQVAYDPGSNVYLVIWEELYSGSDYDANSVLVSGNGALLTSQYIDFSNDRWYECVVADNGLAGTFLVAATVNDDDVRGRIRPANGGAVGPQLVLASAADGYLKGSPALGGDASAIGPTYFLLVYNRFFSPSDWDIHGQLFDGQGLAVGGTILIDNSGGTQDMQPVVSRTNGHPPFSTQRWNVMWARGPQHGSSVDDLRAAQLTWDGLVHTSSFNLTGSPTVFENLWADQLGCTPPLDDPSGKEREWAVCYTQDLWPAGYPGVVRLMRGSSVLDTLDVGVATGQPNMAFYDMSIDSDGVALSVCSNSFIAGQAFTLKTTGHKLSMSEGPLPIDVSPEFTRSASMALAQGPLTSGPRGLCVVQEGPNSTDGDIFAALYEAKHHALGSPACSSNPNSTGYMSFLSALGSEKVADNRLTLECQNMPPFQVGIAIASQNPATIPFGQGVLCVGGPLFRFSQQIANSGAGGWVALDINLTNLPGGMVVLPGQTWFFQFWHRDGPNVNFSNSVGIGFQ